MELFENTLQIGGICIKTLALRFSFDGKLLKTKLFENNNVAIIMIFPA